MASEKNERLVNLTICLLATKKFLTKNQIFKAVAGYEGSAEATDRMFERDKEELRSLGIQIEMRSIDRLFDDEIGYRISPERYKFDLGPLSSEEIALLAIAAQAWKESALKDVALSASIRLQSLGINSDFSELPLAPTVSHLPDNVPTILEAIESSKLIEIQYTNQDDQNELKNLAALGLYSRNSRWYLYAVDTAKNERRSYRLDRFSGDIKRTNISFEREPFSFPDTHFPKIDAILRIRRDFAASLLKKSEIIEADGDWITCKVQFESLDVAVSEILRNSPNILALQPINLVSEISKALSELVAIYG
jgi:proteasome accessory factor B